MGSGHCLHPGLRARRQMMICQCRSDSGQGPLRHCRICYPLTQQLAGPQTGSCGAYKSASPAAPSTTSGRTRAPVQAYKAAAAHVSAASQACARMPERQLPRCPQRHAAADLAAYMRCLRPSRHQTDSVPHRPVTATAGLDLVLLRKDYVREAFQDSVVFPALSD